MHKYILSAILCFCLCLTTSINSTFAEELAKFNANGWDITFRSMVSLNLYSTDNSEEVPNGYDMGVKDTTFSPGDSRINMRFNKDVWRGCFEVRNKTAGIYDREPLHFYWAEYNFNMGRIMVGRNTAPSKLPLLLPPPVKAGLSQLIGHKPAPQVRLTFPIGNSGVEWLVAALQQDDWLKDKHRRLTTGAVEDHHDLPALETRLDIPWRNFKINFIAGYEDYYELTADNKEYSYPSYLYGVALNYRTPKFLFEASLFKDHNNYSHNGDPHQKGYQFTKNDGDGYYGDPWYDDATDSVIESDYLGWAIGVNYFLNEKLSLHAGFGQGWTEDDLGDKDPSLSYEFFAVVKIAKHLRIIPFVNVMDWQDRTPVGESSIEEGRTMNIGVKTQILFW